jgi:hypothetical protein
MSYPRRAASRATAAPIPRLPPVISITGVVIVSLAVREDFSSSS